MMTIKQTVLIKVFWGIIITQAILAYISSNIG